MNKLLTKEEIYENIIDYISSPYSNQITGFYELTGYWDGKSKILSNIPLQNLKNLYNVICESFNTVEDVKDKCRTAVNEKLKPYAMPKPGRKSDWEKELRNIRTGITSHSKKCFDFIQRHRFLAGLCVGENLNRTELEQYVNKIEDDELQSNVYDRIETQLSNAEFRVEIFYSFVKGTSYEDIALNKLKEIARRRLELHQIDLKRVEKEFKKLDVMHKIVDKFVEECHKAEEIAKKLRKRLCDAQEVYRKEANISINGLSISEILKLKEYIHE